MGGKRARRHRDKSADRRGRNPDADHAAAPRPAKASR
jgi:hypothetical protein